MTLVLDNKSISRHRLGLDHSGISTGSERETVAHVRAEDASRQANVEVITRPEI
jgi:hypothetical protein